MAEQQRAQQVAEQQREQQLAEQRRVEQQRIEQQRGALQRAAGRAAARGANKGRSNKGPNSSWPKQQQAEQQIAEQRREDALRRQAAEQERARLAQQASRAGGATARRRGRRAWRAKSRRASAVAGGIRPALGSRRQVTSSGSRCAGRAAGALPRSELASDLANRARDLVRGIDILKPLPDRPCVRPKRLRADLRRALAETVRHDVPLRMYADSVRQKIERNAVLGIAQMAGQDVRTDPVVSVAVRSDGSVEDVTIVRSSGRPDIDELVRRIVRLNARYSAFPPNVAAHYDTIELRRVWSFAGALRLLEEMR
jgi:TonB family protein